MTILRVALDVPLDTLFDYDADGCEVAIGQRVLVQFGHRKLVGVVIEKVAQSTLPESRIKPILQAIKGERTLSSEILKILKFCSEYYHFPIGQVVMGALPNRLRMLKPAPVEKARVYRLSDAAKQTDENSLPKKALLQRRLWSALGQFNEISEAELVKIASGWRTGIKALVAHGWVEVLEKEALPLPLAPTDVQRPTLNYDQASAVEAITASKGKFQPWLLYGITGSGKTEVYMRLLETVLQEATSQVLVLVPEINLTPQLEGRFRARFPDRVMVSLHSQLNDTERLRHWRWAESGQAHIIIGTRLSIFTPIPQLRMIIVDEEHDSSFRQQEGMHYSARDVALVRAKQADIPVVLGSATPSLESWYNATTGRYELLHLKQRAISAAQMPDIHCVTAKPGQLYQGFTPDLLSALKERKVRGEQSLLFINRRGFAPVLLCTVCAWVASCSRCTSRLVVHLGERRLRCHHCGHEERIPKQCPGCGNTNLSPTGHGTQRLEATLTELLPEARLLRVDRDSTQRKGSLQAMMTEVHDQNVDILIGTQMLAKGHDFPNITLVGVMDTDSALFSPDFRAAERLFAQLMQVSGRAGRAEKPGQVLIQTAFPDHPLFEALKRHDYAAFAETLLEERRMAGFPPFCFQAVLRAEANQLQPVSDFLNDAADMANGLARQVTIYDPVRPAMARLKGMERAHLMVQAESRPALQAFLNVWVSQVAAHKLAAKVRWGVEVDPA